MISKGSPWYEYAVQTLPVPGGPEGTADRMEWGTCAGVGPGSEVLGRSLRGRRVLELGCGQGQNAAHLADRHHAQVTAVDLVDLQIQRARERYGEVPGLTLLACDAMRFLQHTETVFDIVYSVFGAVGLVEPGLLLAAIARRVRPHGLLGFSVPHPGRPGAGSSRGHQPRHGTIRLPDGSRHPIARWELSVADWRRYLLRSGMRTVAARELGHPGRTHPTALLVIARRN
ncbi:class I SAM-dependent methyltransferase [Streptomyces californicus]|uniref:class I SAM-dependent methyltransferase n=1 Tax=Streptomyces californicus TaxID=67351 RepID=UPI0036FA1893